MSGRVVVASASHDSHNSSSEGYLAGRMEARHKLAAAEATSGSKEQLCFLVRTGPA